jgi:molecular chaperone IbpA
MVTSRALANLFDTASLAPHFVGFDSLFDRLNEHYQLHTTTNFPPYNIRKLEENKWQVEVALAGYDRKDIEVKTIEGNLVVGTVDKKTTEDPELVHRGISQRKFSRTWSMADDAVVNEAKMKDGMLYVKIERIVPDEKKPKLIKIS